MAGVLDADTHIAEPPQMWDYLDPEWRSRRPVIVEVPDDTVYGGSDHMWLKLARVLYLHAHIGDLCPTPSTQEILSSYYPTA